MPTMRALVKTDRGVALGDVPVPSPRADEVRIRVQMAGVCRTDIYVARGQIESGTPVILGHEFAGWIDRVGSAVRGLYNGTFVAVCPLLGCKRCDGCLEHGEINCIRPTMLGVDRDGAFAEYVCVPSTSVVPFPEGPDWRLTDWRLAAYAEPVAAAMALEEHARALIFRERNVLILGRNRFADLLLRVCDLSDWEIFHCDPDTGDPEPAEDTFEMVIETGIRPGTIDRMIRAARFDGTIILRSRPPAPISFDLMAALRKQLRIQTVNYGRFDRAVERVVRDAKLLEGLLGPVYALEDFGYVFDQAEVEETEKLFFDPTGENVRHPG